jgi:hypothetical protein
VNFTDWTLSIISQNEPQLMLFVVSNVDPLTTLLRNVMSAGLLFYLCLHFGGWTVKGINVFGLEDGRN